MVAKINLKYNCYIYRQKNIYIYWIYSKE